MYFLREAYFYGTELIPLFPYLRAGLLREKKGGGGSQVVSDGSFPDNRMMICDHSPKGFLTSGSTQALTGIAIIPNMSSTLVPSNLPADQAVVIQLLSIG